MYSAKVIGPRARMRATSRSLRFPTIASLAAHSGHHSHVSVLVAVGSALASERSVPIPEHRDLRIIDGELIASGDLMSAGGPWTRPARDVIEPSPLQPTDDTQHLPWGPADPSVFLIPPEELSRCSRLILRG